MVTWTGRERIGNLAWKPVREGIRQMVTCHTLRRAVSSAGLDPVGVVRAVLKEVQTAVHTASHYS